MTALPQRYDWQRFWIPTTGHINLSDGGYLVNPRSDFGRVANPDLKTFEQIATTPCLILLGEPGMGKTYSMEELRRSVAPPCADDEADPLWLNLRGYGSEVRLVNNLFGSPVFVEWLQTDKRLDLFLDSFDECQLRIDYLGSLLVDELQRCPVSRLRLRIACRTADWSAGLTMQFKQLWADEDSVGHYELAPLCREDVLQAVTAEGLDSVAFLTEVDRRAAVPWAIKPLTLHFLMNIYRQEGNLPPDQTRLYRDGCRILCEEPDPLRARNTGVALLTARQRLAIASRIAAVMVFSQRPAVWTGLDLGAVPAEDVLVTTLSGGTERVSGDELPVSEAAVREVLGTGLFSSRGPDRMGWAHQAYAEFLAAEYLINHQMPMPQLRSLLVHSGSPDGKLVPQLHETAAWVAGSSPDLFHRLSVTEPEVLLQGDPQAVNDGARSILVQSILDRHDENGVRLFNASLRARYSRLDHPSLPGQLRTVLSDLDRSEAARFAAIDIAEACEVRELLPDLLTLALNPSQSHDIRVHAASAVANYGDPQSRIQLRPLAIGVDTDGDPDDRLKGHALRVNWPESLTAEELFLALTMPKTEFFLASYQTFLMYDIEARLAPTDLPLALRWVADQDGTENHSHEIDQLKHAILYRSWREMDVPEVLPGLARVASTRLRRHEPLTGHGATRDDAARFEQEFSRDAVKRRRLLMAVTAELVDARANINLMSISRPSLLVTSDVPWLLECLDQADPQTQPILACLIRAAFNPSDLEQSASIFEACNRHAVLASQFAWLLQPMMLDSPETQSVRQQFFEDRRFEEEFQARRAAIPSPVDRMLSILATCESGAESNWWELTIEMTREVGSAHYGDAIEPDLTTLPGWALVDATIQQRIVAGAQRYVAVANSHTDEWLGTDHDDYRAAAGYKALRLLLSEARDTVIAFDEEVWRRWAPIIVAYPSSKPLHPDDEELLRLTKAHAPK